MSLAFLVFDIGLILKWMTRCEGISFLLNIKKSGSQVPKMNGAGLTKQNKGCGHVFLLREKKTKNKTQVLPFPVEREVRERCGFRTAASKHKLVGV